MTYAPKGTTPYDTHKKSELRGVYNSMLKLNKDAPLSIIENNKPTHEFAVSVKEDARSLRNTIASLGGLDKETLMGKKVANSSNPSIAEATYIGPAAVDENLPSFNIEVLHLANTQVNSGVLLPEKANALPAGTYSFDINIHDLNYEFQYSINDGETNIDVQNRLSRLISNSNLGLKSTIESDNAGNSALRIESLSTGQPIGKDLQFVVSDNKTSKTAGSVSYFGLDQVSKKPQDASFLLNDEERFTSSNNFSVEKLFEVTLTGIGKTPGESTNIGVKPDLDSITDNMRILVQGYNKFIESASTYLSSQKKAATLVNEMAHVSSLYTNELSDMGLQFNATGNIQFDEDALKSSMSDDTKDNTYETIKNFAGSLLRKTAQISLNPMQYVNKTVVAYKNPGKTLTAPYAPSAYSGMMFNSYC